MKKIFWVGLAIVSVALSSILTLPVFAHGPDGDGAAPTEGTVWETMHEACETGDWEAMVEAAEEVHGEDFNSMPCHGENDYDPANYWGGTAGHMGRGMMGW